MANPSIDARFKPYEMRKFGGLYWQAAKNAKARAIPFSLTKEEFDRIVSRANGRCELSGIVFRECEQHKRNPYNPSLDRADSSKGYEFGNCRLVCVAVNLAMNAWGIDVLIEISEALRQRMSWSTRENVRSAQKCEGRYLCASDVARICGPSLPTRVVTEMRILEIGPAAEQVPTADGRQSRSMFDSLSVRAWLESGRRSEDLRTAGASEVQLERLRPIHKSIEMLP